ncbi:MAG: lysylphosphatidylglycerol synthetase [Firmicutes bacterium HGW-Firmicutes-7]|nr:MAG: lysylphosphatidylglycerol synthetase [Firmicutes bacterium HGW-Firmicutes-7]
MKIFTFLKKHKPFVNGLLFLTVAFLTGYTIFFGNNISDLIKSMSNVSLFWRLLCVVAVLLFIGVESFILWILLKQKDKKLSIFKCLKYAFVGYFYSGITPSATGGQPVQLYYMIKDGNGTDKSTVTLLSMALFYKLIMVIMGVSLLIFFSNGITAYLDVYVWVYYLGLTLNVLILFVILTFMLIPEKTKSIILKLVQLLMNIKVLKENNYRKEKIDSFITGYKNSVDFLFQNKFKMGVLTLLTFIQRSSLLFVPVFIYLGLHLKDTSLFTILCIQAAIYVAVDMLPIPGAQGITELIYISAFGSIFTEQYLTTSMIITRSVSFYLPLLIGMIVVIFNGKFRKKQEVVI